MVVMGVRWVCDIGLCLRRVRRDMERAMSGWEVREWMRMERERDLGGGFVRSAVVVRLIAVERWSERQRRGRRRFMFVNSCWVRVALVVGFDGREVSVEEENGAMEGWKRGEMMGFEGKERS
jgi:hypothetical protein